jgi:hypothetical protein
MPSVLLQASFSSHSPDLARLNVINNEQRLTQSEKYFLSAAVSGSKEVLETKRFLM